MLHGGLPPHFISGRVGHHDLAWAPFWLQAAACAWHMHRAGWSRLGRRGWLKAWRMGGWAERWAGGRGSALQALQHSVGVFRWKPGLPSPHTTARSPEYPVWTAVWHVWSSIAADPRGSSALAGPSMADACTSGALAYGSARSASLRSSEASSSAARCKSTP